MNPGRTGIRLFFAVLLIALCLAEASAQSAPEGGFGQGKSPKPKSVPSEPEPTATMRASIASQLAGTWRLVSYQEKLGNGTVQSPYGENPQGVAIFEPGGYFSVQIMKIPRANYPSGYDKATVEQLKAVQEAYLAYYGTWAVDEGHSALLEHVRASNQPHLNNQMTTQRFDFQGQRLSLRTVLDTNAGQQSIEFLWEKIH
jgi:hypothetical protein